MPVLTFVDTLGIQSFVFSSNRLRDVVGGSELVHQATSRDGWVRALGYGDHVIVGAGGNLLLRFADLEGAMRFSGRFSRKLLDEAPELEAAIVHHPYENGKLTSAIQEVQVKTEEHKLERCPAVPLLGLGVTAACRETLRPAVDLDREGRPISSSVHARRAASARASKRWLRYVAEGSFRCSGGPPVNFDFPLDLDDLGRSHGDMSMIGVVHVDGNGIGQKLKWWLDGRAEAPHEDDCAVVDGYRNLSVELDGLADRAFRVLTERVISAISWEEQGGYVLRSPLLEHGIPLRLVARRSRGARLLLPIRPILLGGDDLTFVCDGRIALDLAAEALREYERADERLSEICGVRASAGVAIVNPHAPFARAYRLAQNLSTSAKQLLRKKNWTNRSAMDWHISLTSPAETLGDMRRRQYQQDKLTCRPYLLRDYDKHLSDASWTWLAGEVLGERAKGLRTSGSGTANWQGHRAKLKTLREIIKESGKVDDAIDAWRVVHPDLALPDRMSNGFIGERSPLLDAIELLDVHFPLSRRAAGWRAHHG